ncbi:hypothetical protein B0H17DRAFT_1144878 [Mycena rosella]|uniref:F-box domain-containing protein n=1 Tax=Mycena rosella TaxID=1033263 RepID=A0AAD7CSI8_MYCRO|nr:hypothetical protein B0H17DRAFT_1144878 [Mycena rosella]
MFEALQAHCTHSPLMCLEVGCATHHYMTPYAPVDSDDTKLPSCALHPLLAFTNLRALALKSPFGITLDQAVFWQMALVWPGLERLTLTAARGLTPPLPFRALHALAQHCPCLIRLDICVDVSKVPEFRCDIAPEVRSAALVASYSWLSEHSIVADFSAHIDASPAGYTYAAGEDDENIDGDSDASDKYFIER